MSGWSLERCQALPYLDLPGVFVLTSLSTSSALKVECVS
jgi:hypothetical protein